ncbi:MAG: homoserine dehydrogenase [Anaerofustis sp.]
MIQLALLGLGTVGQGVYEIVDTLKEKSFHGNKIRIKKILERDTAKLQRLEIPSDQIAGSIDEITGDADIGIVVSVLGGMEPEYTFIKQALTAGKHVVTSNKAIVSAHLEELLDLAKAHDVTILFEASVGGGIPIIGSLIETLKINEISHIQGILNGTTNYILTKMKNEKRSFEDVLAQAQRLGFAEANPGADIDGFDIMRKICILASIAFKTAVKEEDVHLRTLSNVMLEDLQMAVHYGYELKYIGKAVRSGATYSISVTPVLIPKTSVVSNVDEEYNIIMINGNIIGELCFMGKGAGKDATANAVVTDVLKIINSDITNEDIGIKDTLASSGLEGIANEYYIRVCVDNYKQFSKAVNLISDQVQRNKIVFSYGKLFVLTEEISAQAMKTLYEKLQRVAPNVFYARLENNSL